MKKRILFLLFALSCVFSAAAQTPGWTKMKPLNNDIATRHSSQMAAYNNKLYFLGGYGLGVSSNISDFWEYDPQTKTFNELSTLPPDLFPNAIASDGSMWVIGDDLYYLGYGGQVRVYNFITKQWVAKPNFPAVDQNGHIPTSFVINNIIYAVSDAVNTFYSYDPVTNVWTQKASYPGTIRQGGFSFSVNGKGYKGGGRYTGGGVNSEYPLEFYEYNPVTDTWAQKASMPSSLSFAVAVGCNDKGYVGTGQLPSPFPYSTGTWYEYNPDTNVWAVKASAPAVMESSGASLNNDIYLFSGKVYTPQIGIISTGFITKYNTLTNTWTTDTAYAGGNRTFANGIHHNGKIYITGGDDSEQRTDTWEYTIATNSWVRKANMPGTGFSLNGQAIIGSKLYLVGGLRRAGSGNLPVYSNALLQYDASTNVWDTKASFPGGALAEIGAFTLNNELYAGCGWSGSPSVQSDAFYKYNASANTWSALASCPSKGPVYAAFSIGDIGYFVFGTNSAGTSIMYGYDRVSNTWSLKQPVPEFSGGQSGNNTSFVKDGLAYLVGLTSTAGAGFSYSKIKKYDPVADKWTYVSEAPFFKKGHTIVNTGDDIYIGFGLDQNIFQSSGTYYHVENDWYKLNLEAEVSTFTGDKVFNCTGSQSLQANQIQTFTDDEGKLFVSLQASPASVASPICITQRSLSASSPFRENKIVADGNIPYTAIFMNKNFAVTSGGPTTGAKIRMYFTDAELSAFIAAFNTKYGSNKTINDIKIISSHNGSGVGNLDPGDNTNNYAVYTPTVSNYKTGNKYLEYAFLNGQGIVEGYAALLINSQTITFPAIAAKTYGTIDFVPGATSNNSTIPITYSSSNTAVATITADAKIRIVGAGSVVITASQAANASYTAASPVLQTITVDPAPLSVTAENKTKVYGSANPTLTASYTGFVNGDDASKLATSPLISTTATTGSAVNTYPITASGAVSSNYTFTYTAGILTVNKAPLTITAKDSTKVYDGLVFTGGNGTSFTGFVNGDQAANSLTGTPSFTGTSQNAKNSGKYTLIPSGYAAVNYTITFANGELTVNPKSLGITADNKAKVQGTANPALTASYTGFVSGETSSVLSILPSLATTATLTSVPGTYPITASGATALNYTIKYVAGVLTVTPASPVITSFTPATTGVGAHVTITGNYFTGASAVSFGGVPAASFTVVSPTTITAVTGPGASGSVSVKTNIGATNLAGYTFVPKPSIKAGGQTTFATGGSVVLTASPGTGYTYKWAKNGADISGATGAAYTATTTGSYTVSITVNVYTLTSDAIGVNVIFNLPANNFTLTASGETCKTSNNGKINITAIQSKNYTAALTGNGLSLTKPFTNTLDFIDLKAGLYKVCITVAGEPDYTRCFDLAVTEPKDLSVYTAVNTSGDKITLTMDGSDTYTVELNGMVYKTGQNQLSLSLKAGDNILRVSTGKDCQGVLEKRIHIDNKPMVYPNPFENTLNVNNLNSAATDIEIRGLNGKVVFNQRFSTESNTLSLDLTTLNPGIYRLKVASDNKETIYKIIKR